MPDKHKILRRLVRLSRSLGRPEKDYVILSEGNTSARIIDDAIFWLRRDDFRRGAARTLLK